MSRWQMYIAMNCCFEALQFARQAWWTAGATAKMGPECTLDATPKTSHVCGGQRSSKGTAVKYKIEESPDISQDIPLLMKGTLTEALIFRSLSSYVADYLQLAIWCDWYNCHAPVANFQGPGLCWNQERMRKALPWEKLCCWVAGLGVAMRLSQNLYRAGVPCSSIHGDKDTDCKI